MGYFLRHILKPYAKRSSARSEKNCSKDFALAILTYIFLGLFLCKNLSAQNNAKRYEIDAKRMGVNYYDKDALPRSREFIRLDST